MAGSIKILSEDIANKIAAGEVIENPASVVKELVENSIDAGSSRIEVEIRDGGKEFIRISDNGRGMSREDASIAFERHATSKIRDADDLFAITTLGFRGEALPSICAVSRVELLTKRWEDVIGTRILTEGGKIISIEDVGTPAGSSTVVRDLFFNTPARLKYLKGSPAEGRNVLDVMNQMILSHPEVSFLVIRDGEEVVKSSGSGKLLDSIAAVYGLKVAREMHMVGAGLEGIKISGYVGSPTIARKNRRYQQIIVNGRPVRDNLIRSAVERAYDTFLTVGTFPVFLLVIQIDPEEVDVNVHPTKAEVRFADESLIFKGVFNAVRQGLRSNTLIPQAGAVLTEKVEEEAPKEDSKPHMPERIEQRLPLFTKETKEYKPQTFREEAREVTPIKEMSTWQDSDDKEVPIQDKKEFGEYKILGQLHKTYIILETGDGLFIVDQHAAHERITFEKLKERNENGTGYEAQQLLAPITIELAPGEVDAFFQVMDTLRDIGFDLEYFGTRSFILRAIPAFLRRLSLPDGLKDIVDELQDAKNIRGGKNRREDHLHIIMACRASIKAGNELHHKEIEALMAELLECKDPYTCPHGRPTIVSFSLYDLEKLFKRT